MSFRCVAFGLALLPCTAHADIVWRGDFESGDVSQWNEQVGPVADRVSIVEDPVREGMYAARVEIRPGDLGIGDLNRVELGYHPPRASFEGSERWYAWSVMQDAYAPLGASWHAFTYWEATMISTAALSFRLYAGNAINFATFVGGEQVQWESTFEPGVWHDFVLHVVWSGDASEGLVELWYDGEQVVPATSVATMFTVGDVAAPNFLHIGMIRDDQLTVDEVFFYDGVIEATSQEDLMPSASDTSGGASDESTGANDESTSDAPATTTTSTTNATSEDGGSSSGAAADDDAEEGCGCASERPAGALGVLAVLLFRRRRPAHRPR
ncbi:MAG TPA: polysaccharide lyase [Nannocystaceae bacterium]|nr:polysaccharide lyase [Nannocystaceae bacterium]